MRTTAFMFILILIWPAPVAVAQLTSEVEALDGVGIDEKLDNQLPLNLTFRDTNGKEVRLAQLFDGERPVILSLNYSDCPMLCQLQLNGLLDTLSDMEWNAGAEFHIVSVSINPLETPQRARQTKQRYVQAYGRPGTAAGWHFLTGDQSSIEQLADAVGFRYQYLPDRREYAHAAAVMVCTPAGRVSRYLYGVLYPRQTLKLSLVEAGEGKIGSTFDHVLLYCFHYDAAAGRYAPVARQLMKIAAGLTLTALLLGLLPWWLRRGRRENPVSGDTATELVEGSVS